MRHKMIEVLEMVAPLRVQKQQEREALIASRHLAAGNEDTPIIDESIRHVEQCLGHLNAVYEQARACIECEDNKVLRQARDAAAAAKQAEATSTATVLAETKRELQRSDSRVTALENELAKTKEALRVALADR